ncbi:MAG: DUF4358 domain-containing protein, partial [Peptococcaceae bacterium]|nr:DUF4358 domain-containing protein [Peptococcaceae bacterium]
MGKDSFHFRVVCLLVLALYVMTACGSPSGGGGGAFAMDVNAFGETVYQSLTFRDQLEELPPAVVCTLLGIDGDAVLEQKNYFSSGATAEEFIVFHAASSEAFRAIKAAVETRITDQMDIYASYAPEEVSYLKGAVLAEKGEYLVYCVSADSDAAK